MPGQTQELDEAFQIEKNHTKSISFKRAYYYC